MGRIFNAVRDLSADVAIRRGVAPPEMANTKWGNALVRAEARRNPGLFRQCSACGSGPWHHTWMSWDGVLPPEGTAKCWIGPCCSGAD